MKLKHNNSKVDLESLEIMSIYKLIIKIKLINYTSNKTNCSANAVNIKSV